ncbi:TatD family hydrolase [Gemmatimonadota bacterium]
MKLVDTHAHLFWEDYEHDLDEVMDRARDVGVEAILNLGTDGETSAACVELAERYPDCWAAAGIHPNDASLFDSDRDAVIGRIRDLLSHPKVIAVGESGLDLYRDRVPLNTQLECLEVQFDLARESGLPIVLHNRQADAVLRDVLSKWDEGVTAILHCFVGDADFGKWAIDRGHFLGLGGVFTFPSSSLREMVGEWNLDHLLLETDSPFLSPVPYRGKRNEPSYVADTAVAVADTLGMAHDSLAERTAANAYRVLNIPISAGSIDLTATGS